MKATKSNRVYTITEVEAESYRKEGYDIYSDDGKLVMHGVGKNVSYDKYEALLNDYEALMAENAKLQSEISERKDGEQTSFGKSTDKKKAK